MIISSSTIDLSSQHQKVEQSVERERLRVWLNKPGRPVRQPAEQGVMRFAQEPQLSRRARAVQPVTQKADLKEGEVDPIADTKMQALINLVERLTGKKIKFFNAKDLQAKTKNIEQSQTNTQAPQPAAQRAGFGIEYDYYNARIEEEQTSFSAEGIVNTADGREISLTLKLNMSRRFMEEHSLSIRAGDAQQRLKDPLALNFNGNAAQLNGQTFSFDLDSDGREDQIALLDSNSGYLALDKNGDGAINNGSELFGANSGNGFADLSKYDEDGNQWIDEADSIYKSLRIWTRDSSGNDQLFALGQKDVGAIYLGNLSTPFDLKDSDNTLLGQVANSGLFLKESGGVGTVQQLNLVV